MVFQAIEFSKIKEKFIVNFRGLVFIINQSHFFVSIQVFKYNSQPTLEMDDGGEKKNIIEIETSQ